MFFNISFIHLHKLSNICVVFLPVEEPDIPTVLYIWCCFPGICITSFVANSPKFFVLFSLSNFYALCTIKFYTGVLAITRSDFLLWTDNEHHQQSWKAIRQVKMEAKWLQLKIFLTWTKQPCKSLECDALTTVISLSMAAKSVIINLLKSLHSFKFQSSLPPPPLHSKIYGFSY